MTQLEIASRAAAGAMGMNPATEWERARPVAEAVLAAIAGRETAEEIFDPDAPTDWSKPRITGEDAERIDEFARPMLTWSVGVVGYVGDQPDRTTSPEVAAIAARGIVSPETLTHDEIQSVCASALVQR